MLGEDHAVTAALPGVRRALLRLVGPVVVALALAGCITPESLVAESTHSPDSTGGSATAGSSESPATASGEPSAGTSEPAETPEAAAPTPPSRLACRRLSYQAALAPTDDSAERHCRRPNTAQTYHVGRLDTVVDGHLVAVDSERVQAQVARTCPRRLPEFLGAADPDLLDLTMIRPVWFTPTVEESDGGAHWFRCDAVVLRSPEWLARFSDGGLRGVLADEDALDRYGMCSESEPGTKRFAPVLCREPHSWQAIERVDLTHLSDGEYPGADQVQVAGEAPCQAAGREAAGDPLDYEWAYEWPTALQWRSGQHFGRCWIPD